MATEEEKHEETESYEDEIVESLLRAVRLPVKETRTDQSGVKIIADSLEIVSKPQMPTEIAEEIKPFSQMLNEKISKVIKTVSDTIDGFQDTFKEAVRAQIAEFTKALKELGYIVAKSFAEKLNIRIMERHLRRMYEEIAEKVIAEKGKEFLQNTLQAIIPLYSEIAQRLQMLQQDVNDIWDLYLSWIQGFSSIVAEEIHSSRDEIGELIDKKKELERRVQELEKENEELKRKLQEGAGVPSAEYENLILELQKKDAELKTLREQFEELRAKYDEALKQIGQLKNALKEREVRINELEARLKTLREGAAISEDLQRLKEYYEQQLLQKEKEIASLKAQLEELSNLKQTLQSFMSELKSLAPVEISPDELVSPEEVAKAYQEFLETLKNEIQRLREEYHSKLKELSEIMSRNKVLEERVAILEQELENYRKKEEELTQELTKLKSEKALLENKLKELEGQISGSMPQLSELEKILELTILGKAYLVIRNVRRIDLDRLAATLGVSKLQLRTELLKLQRAGIIRIEGNTVVYTGAA